MSKNKKQIAHPFLDVYNTLLNNGLQIIEKIFCYQAN